MAHFRRAAPLLLLGFATAYSYSGMAAEVREPAFTLDHVTQNRSIGMVVLSPDKSSVVYSHVGRYFGHPVLPTYGEDNNLFLLTLASAARVQLTTGTATKAYPAFSPDGRFVSYESEGDVWSVEIASGRTQRLTTDWAADRSAVWSPDGKEIAFYSARWGRSTLYVMSASGERVSLRAVAELGDVWPQGFGGQTPVWSTDGKYLLFCLGREPHFYSREIYRVPATGGGELERLTPLDNSRNNWPSFSPDGARVAYIADRSGFLNIWTMAADGTDHRQVTNVTQDQDYIENDHIQTMGLRWSPDGTRILHFSNRLGNFELRSVNVRTGATEAIENKDGLHHPVGWLDDRTVAYVHESYRSSPQIFVKPLKGVARQVTADSYAAFRPEHFETLEAVSWTSADGVAVHGYLRRPSWAKPDDQLPALVMSHTYNVGQFYNQWVPIFSYIVQSGYVILQVNHRGSSGYGKQFRELPKGNWGLAQLKDHVSAAAFLRAQPQVDPASVGMLGYSMGGFLTQLAITNEPELFAAAVAIFGLGELYGDPQKTIKNYIWHFGGPEAQLRDAYARASPITNVARMRTPLLIIHSDADPIEPVTKVRNLTSEMDRLGKEYELKLYSNEAHGLKILEHQKDSYERVMSFLDRRLAKGRKP
jgi:dipeptidyl aminopeptidase/acylaminoacyl peptidase